MHDVNHAIAILRSVTGLDELDFDEGNHIEVLYADALPMHFVKLGEQYIEVFADLGTVEGFSSEQFKACLSRNHLGNASGAGRIALASDGRTLVLGERLNVRLLDADSFEQAIGVFLDRAMTMLETGELLASPTASPDPVEFDDSQMIIRG